MKQHEAKLFLPIIQAWADGKTIQFNRSSSGNNFYDVHDVIFDSPPSCYRIKPEPKLRAWKREEVPIGALFRPISEGRGWVMQIVGVNWALSGGVRIYFEGGFISPEKMLEQDEHSTDGGKTWLPCGVLEEAKG